MPHPPLILTLYVVILCKFNIEIHYLTATLGVDQPSRIPVRFNGFTTGTCLITEWHACQYTVFEGVK